MLFGINWVSPRSFSIIRKLIDENVVDFCEIMVDNFAHLPSRAILEILSDIPISLHIVSSPFLEKTPAELRALADYLRPWIKELKPLYVSDHLLTFTASDGRRLPLINELHYEAKYEHIKNRICLWQDLLDTPLLFENHASLTPVGSKQAFFFERLLEETGAGLLYDFSNAYIAEYNQVALRTSWDHLISRTKHFHVAGFRVDEMTHLALDTHDTSISTDVMHDIKTHLHSMNHQDKTLVVEFDANVNIELWKHNILQIKKNLSHPKSTLSFNAINPINDIRNDSLTYLAAQNLRHRLMRDVPSLLKISNNRGDDILKPFLHWADENKLAMDWTLHLFLLHWLAHHEKWMQQITPELAKELMIASVIRWSLSGFDYLHAKGIFISTPYLPNVVVCLWKNKEADQSSKVTIMHDPEKIASALPCYAIFYQHSDWKNLSWQSLSNINF